MTIRSAVVSLADEQEVVYVSGFYRKTSINVQSSGFRGRVTQQVNNVSHTSLM